MGRSSPIAYDRYRKGVKSADIEKASGHYVKSAIAGTALGLALRRNAVTRRRAAALGAAAGLGAQAITRAATSQTKDWIGERSTAAKVVDAATPTAIGATALIAGSRRLRKKIGGFGNAARRGASWVGSAIKESVQSAIRPWQARAAGTIQFGAVQRWLKKPRTISNLITGGALAGGITVADAATSSATEPHPNAVATGAKRGLIYGSVLAGTEPGIRALLKRAVRKTHLSAATDSGKLPELQFGGRQQFLDEHGRFVDPLRVASGEATGFVPGSKTAVSLPVLHGQTIRAAINRGATIQKWGRRSGNLASDVVGATSGKPSDGRKREWQKAWFKNAIGSVLAGGALLGHASALKHSPRYRAKVRSGVSAAKAAVNRVIPDWFPTRDFSALNARLDAALGRGSPEITFDVPAAIAGWDVRDPRGRSARVFAPGAGKRERREKKWHERATNQRLLGLLGALGAAGAAGAIGWKLGRRRGPAVASAAPGGNVIAFPRTA